MIDDLLAQAAHSAWALPAMFALVLGDAFLVVIPGEAAVSAFGALAVTAGSPPLASVIGLAALAAFTGDACCFLVGRTVGLTRWRWMRTTRVQAAFAWARARLHRRTAVVVFTARFIPFARLAVNLVAGASGVRPGRYLGIVAIAATAWAVYQAIVGAAVGLILPGGPLVAVVVSVTVAVGLGLAIDAIVARIAARRSPSMTVEPPAVSRTAREDERMMDDQTGYDPRFLEREVPLPLPSDERETQVLTYPRFTVALDTARRFAAVTAVNIDGESLLDLPRAGEWDFDPRIPTTVQAGNDVYRNNDLDRGHLVRRRDPGWGEPAEARAAMEATFFYTNAAPQAAGFNQSKELWLGLEDHVLAYAEANDHRVSVFTAPVLEDDDPPYRGIRVPRRFWKVAAWSTTDAAGAPALASAGFVLDQSDLVEAATSRAVAPLGGFRTFQVPVADIADLAAVDLGPLTDGDTLVGTSARGGSVWVPLAARDDITL
ncbi:DNA/RNA non-specific endonuclease [Microbacterium sp. SLBN-146]|uniref:DNA/RNA non-specific endonuclease n=1 Tax=Microbacterium sp. SLBN-146 TaxID=2768457 RepID=UPI0028C4786D|nr:DNA/RNA non-specific endonuclease [Microbacterium sp. SLBN-146]